MQTSVLKKKCTLLLSTRILVNCVLFHKKNWRQAALNWPWFCCRCKPQNASDCISGPLFFLIFHWSRPSTPLRDSRSIGAWCQAPVTLHWELATQRFLENTALFALLGPFTDPNDRFHYPFIYFNEIPTLLYTWGPKKIPLSGGASPYRPS